MFGKTVSLSYSQSLPEEWFQKRSKQQFDVNAPGGSDDVLPVSYPLVTDECTLDQAHHLYPQAADMRRMLILIRLTKAQLSADDPPATGNSDECWDTLLGPVGQRISPWSISNMMEEFSNAIRSFIARLERAVMAPVPSTPGAATEHGCPGQVVSHRDTSDLVTVSPLPLSTADMEYGHVARAALSFVRNPRFVVIPQKSQSNVIGGHIPRFSEWRTGSKFLWLPILTGFL